MFLATPSIRNKLTQQGILAGTARQRERESTRACFTLSPPAHTFRQQGADCVNVTLSFHSLPFSPFHSLPFRRQRRERARRRYSYRQVALPSRLSVVVRVSIQLVSCQVRSFVFPLRCKIRSTTHLLLLLLLLASNRRGPQPTRTTVCVCVCVWVRCSAFACGCVCLGVCVCATRAGCAASGRTKYQVSFCLFCEE